MMCTYFGMECCSSEENWQATADDQLEMDAIFSPQEVRRKDSSNRKKPKDHSSTSSKSLEPTNKVTRSHLDVCIA